MMEISNPQAPEESACRLVASYVPRLGMHLAGHTIRQLACYLATDEACRREGQEDVFRRAKATTAQLTKDLGRLAVAVADTKAPDQGVKAAALNVLATVRNGRTTWKQVRLALTELWSVKRRVGVKRKRATPIVGPRRVELPDGDYAERVRSVQELGDLGRQGRWCTSPSNSSAADYISRMKDGSLHLYALRNAKGSLVGQISIEPKEKVVEEVRGIGNVPLEGYREHMLAFMDALGLSPGSSTDLLGMGLADGFLGTNPTVPNECRRGIAMWHGPRGAVLLRKNGAWAILDPVMDGKRAVFWTSPSWEGFADDLLWTLCRYRPKRPSR